MKFTDFYTEGTDIRTWTLVLDGAEIVRAKLDDFDHRVLADCSGADATVSDKLLALEILVRRIEEAG